MNKPDVRELVKEKILVLDGAMGSLIQTYKLQEEDFRGERFKNHSVPLKGNNDLLGLVRPDILKEIHGVYLEAGADIIETNTFSGTSIAQADYKLESAVYDINYESAKVAKEIADEYTKKNPNKPRYVAGTIGPTNRTLSLSPDVNDPGYRAVTWDEMVASYQEQAGALIDGGVDILMVETIFDTLNAKACLFAIEESYKERGVKLPIMVSGTITDASGRTLSGQTAEAFLASVSHMDLLSVGFNCALGAKMMKPYLEILSNNSEFGISAHPNAGLPNEMGEYDESPTDMTEQIQEYHDGGLVNIIGGCCGTTPEHIKAMAEMAAKYEPREIKSSSSCCVNCD
ncbi:homocysteine S-methyltransferase family protein [Reichenbachiella versicolor]|uniref:homocysteine S-methyltransferase family protein n=1 Tax=Reichenbachiella versicolor TaxID=1821036 RepID=UPI000D6DC5DD|nr:homocysteine S-methyltransferase family protein [Reichenbachiella versicolor]